ncbi:MAG TPA: hypothetical protein VF177_07530 [Anaerolineae bacterium]
MSVVRDAFAILRKSRRPYILLNLMYYGLVICGMIYAAFDRSVQQTLMDAVGAAFLEGPLAGVAEAYTSGQLLLAIVLTLVVNLAAGSFVSITLPSLFVPFSGLLVGGLRAVLWGLIFSPTTLAVSSREVVYGVLALGLLLLEGQGYVLAMLAAVVQGQAFLWPASVGATSRKQGYLMGLKRTAFLYLLVVLVLAVAAVYEAVLAIVILPG